MDKALAHLNLSFIKYLIVSGKVCRNREDIILAWKVYIITLEAIATGHHNYQNCKLLPGGANTGTFGCMLQSTIQFGIASCTKVFPKPLYRSEVFILKPIYAIHYRTAVCKHCLAEKKITK